MSEAKGMTKNMKLRKLEKKDAPYMLEWMHDISVVKDLQANFFEKTLNDCVRFIEKAQEAKTDIHLAIVDDEKDEYLGTASLKHISNKKAEFGITIRKCAMGKGISKEAMKKIIEFAFSKCDIEEIYWCVNQKNERAIRFYLKNKYEIIDIFQTDCIESIKKSGYYSDDQIKSYVWFLVCKHVTTLGSDRAFS